MSARRIYVNNADMQKLYALKTNRAKRRRRGEFLAEGVRNINAAVNNGWRIDAFVYPFERDLSRWAADLIKNVKTDMNYELTGALMASLSGKDDASELMAVVKIKDDGPDMGRLSDNPILTLFDDPSNKGNLGTFFRSCDAFGVEQIIITGRPVDAYDPEVVTASMGSLFYVPFSFIGGAAGLDAFFAGLKKRYSALKVIGTTAHAETAICDIDLTGPALLIFGNETTGLTRGLAERCDALAAVPMVSGSSASSLNISCAATAIFYEAARQRRAIKRC